MGLVQTGACERGHSIDHYFFTCPKYNGIKDKLLETVKEILAKCEGSKSLRQTSLLFTPGSQDGISKRHNRQIFTATFDFIIKSERHL